MNQHPYFTTPYLSPIPLSPPSSFLLPSLFSAFLSLFLLISMLPSLCYILIILLPCSSSLFLFTSIFLFCHPHSSHSFPEYCLSFYAPHLPAFTFLFFFFLKSSFSFNKYFFSSSSSILLSHSFSLILFHLHSFQPFIFLLFHHTSLFMPSFMLLLIPQSSILLNY